MAGISMGIDGLVSGLDTTSIISQLMQIEAAPQTLLQQKKTETTSLVTALQALNTKVASLATNAANVATAGSWNAYTATSSAASVTASASSSAEVSSLSFTVDAVARNQVSLTDAFTNTSDIFPTIPPAITVKKSDGTLTTISPATGDLTDITKAINAASEAGVKAVAVRIGSEYRLQFTSTATGAANGFEIYLGTAADVTAGTATTLALTSTSTASDAQITLWPGSTASQPVTSSSNTFADTLAGVSITVSQLETTPVTVVVGRDDAALAKLGSTLVSGLNLALSEISTQSATTTTTKSDGSTAVTGGVLSGVSDVRDLRQRLQTAASYPIDGISPSTVGISINSDGTFTFDDATFASALAADPAKVQRVVSGLAERLADTAKSASDPISGSLSLAITSQQGTIKDLGDQILSWDNRLALRKEALEATYSALEVTLSNMQAQSSWLASQLSSLPTTTTTSS